MQLRPATAAQQHSCNVEQILQHNIQRQLECSVRSGPFFVGMEGGSPPLPPTIINAGEIDEEDDEPHNNDWQWAPPRSNANNEQKGDDLDDEVPASTWAPLVGEDDAIADDTAVGARRAPLLAPLVEEDETGAGEMGADDDDGTYDGQRPTSDEIDAIVAAHLAALDVEHASSISGGRVVPDTRPSPLVRPVPPGLAPDKVAKLMRCGRRSPPHAK